MQKYRKGFTLAEVLISLMVIGIIMTFAIGAIRATKASYTSLAYYAHKNVTDMVGVLYSGNLTYTRHNKTNLTIKDVTKNTYEGKAHYFYTSKNGSAYSTIEVFPHDPYASDPDLSKRGKEANYTFSTETAIGTEYLTLDGNKLPSMVTVCQNSTGKLVHVLKNDAEKDTKTISCANRPTGNSENLFCKSMVALTNTSKGYNCGADDLYNVEFNSKNEPQFKSINANKPNFRFTNGMRVFISKWTKNANVSSDYGFRLVGVDLNGVKGPNKVEKDTTRPTDIVTFLVLDNGEVYPIGVAADNIKDGNRTLRYLTAKVKGYSFAYKNAAGQVNSYTDSMVPEECRNIDKSNTSANIYKCNLKVGYPRSSANEKNVVLTYREALCKASANRLSYGNYCSSIAQLDQCTGNNYDTCQVETIKPAFRFKF